jgi:hypothetical protein
VPGDVPLPAELDTVRALPHPTRDQREERQTMMQYIRLDIGTACANGRCNNRFGQGPWVIVELDAMEPATNLPAISLSMCAPCATRLSHEPEVRQ